MKITEKYLTKNPYSRPGTKLTSVKNIVVHYVGNPNTSAIANRNYFESLKDKGVYASSQYIIGLNGEIIKCMPESEVAYHAGNYTVNCNSIGIECCHPDSSGKFNSLTYNALIELLKDLCKRYRLNSSNVIRHYDVTGKMCPLFYVKNPSEWTKLKNAVNGTTKPKTSYKDQILTVGDTFTIPGVFKVDAVSAKLDAIACSKLADKPFADYNYIDAKPLVKTTKNGTKTANQVFKVGDYFIIPGTYKTLKNHAKTNSVYTKIGRRKTWIKADPCYEV